MRTDQPTGDAVKNMVEQVQGNVSTLAESTEKKIQSLGDLIKGEERTDKTVEGVGVKMHSSDLLASLAEIAQELAQPLTAINTSLEMILRGYAGDVSAEQVCLLNLASGSGEHMHYLMDQLVSIVGYPINLGVDERFSGKLSAFVLNEPFDQDSFK
jgi:signal transduction histidine kinase